MRVNLQPPMDALAVLERALIGRHGKGGEPSQMLLDSVNMGVEYANTIGALVSSIALDVRRIADALEAREGKS